jgi:hypothetical protein
MQQSPYNKVTFLLRPALRSGVCFFFLLAFVATAFQSSALAQDLPPQPAPVVNPRSSYNEFMNYVNRQRRVNPKKTIAEMREYLAEQPMSSSQAANLYSMISAIYANDLKDNAGALAALDEGLRKLNNLPERYTLVVEKVRVQAASGKAIDAEKVLQENWPGIVNQGLAPRVLPTYVSLLTRNNKAPLALQITRQVALENVERTRELPTLVSSLTDQLLAVGQTDEALSWGKLNFLLCTYNDRSLQNAAQLLSRVWTAKNTNTNAATEFLAALQNPAKPNPLREVKLPALDVEALRRRASQTKLPDERVSLLILAGDWQAAILAARRLMLDRPTSNQGILQVCRVFKAHDLQIQRANAFLEYYRSGEGANPIAEFLSEIELSEIEKT